MRQPRVAIVTPGTFEIRSERTSSVELALKQITGRLSGDVQFCILGKTAQGFPDCEMREGILHIRVAASSAYGYARQIARKLAEFKPDIVQVENRPRLAKWLKRMGPSKASYWLSLHSTTFISRPHIGRRELRRCLKSAGTILVNSRFLGEYIRRKAPVPSHACKVNYLGVDTQQFVSRWEPQQESLRERLVERLGYQGKKIIVYVGRLMKEKGVHHLLNIMPQVVRIHPEAVLVIVGAAYYGSNRVTPYVARLHRAGSRMPQHVKFIPFVTHREICDWYRLADIAVVPSFDREAFGLVNVEAMASGVPVIATRAGGMKEIIIHEQTGYLVDERNLEAGLLGRISSLLANPLKCRELGEASRRHVQQHFTWDHTAGRLLDWYREAVR